LGCICEGWCLLWALLVCDSAPGAHQQHVALKFIELHLN